MEKRGMSLSTIALIVVGLGYAGLKYFAPDLLDETSRTQSCLLYTSPSPRD